MEKGSHKAFLHLNDFEEKARVSTWPTRFATNEAFMLLLRRRGVLELLAGTSPRLRYHFHQNASGFRRGVHFPQECDAGATRAILGLQIGRAHV